MAPACATLRESNSRRKGDAQAAFAVLEHAGAHALVFVAEHQQGGQRQLFRERIHAVVHLLRSAGHESGLPGFLHRAGKIDHLRDGQAFQRASGGTTGAGAEKGAVVLRQNESGAAHGKERAGQRAHVAGILHLIERHHERQRRVRGPVPERFPTA